MVLREEPVDIGAAETDCEVPTRQSDQERVGGLAGDHAPPEHVEDLGPQTAIEQLHEFVEVRVERDSALLHEHA